MYVNVAGKYHVPGPSHRSSSSDCINARKKNYDFILRV